MRHMEKGRKEGRTKIRVNRKYVEYSGERSNGKWIEERAKCMRRKCEVGVRGEEERKACREEENTRQRT
jgi:hypothetical protein